MTIVRCLTTGLRLPDKVCYTTIALTSHFHKWQTMQAQADDNHTDKPGSRLPEAHRGLYSFSAIFTIQPEVNDSSSFEL